MGLLDLQTNLKDYKFGQAPASDRPGGGNSGQPYIKNPIDNNIIPQSEDFLFRGGLNAPLDAGVDVARLTKFFGDLKSPSGVLFVAKQNTLSRIGVRTQASPTALNEGAYTPLSTLAQAGIGFAGAHVYKQGVNPLKGVTTYLDIVNEVVGDGSGVGNRLVDYTKNKINNLSDINPLLTSYPGGPNSVLGIGNTDIEFATTNQGNIERTGLNNDKLRKTGFFNTPTLEGISSTLGSFGITSNPDLPSQVDFGFNVFKRSSSPNKELKKDKILFRNVNTVLNQYKKLLGETRNLLDSGFNYNTDPSTTDSNSNPFLPNAPTVYPDITNPIKQKGDNAIYNNGSVTMNQEQLNNQPTPKENKPNPGSQIQDFRKSLLEGDKKDNAKKIMGFAPNYSADKQKMEGKVGSRVGLASPGQRGNRSNYDSGKQGISGYKGVDLINLSKVQKRFQEGEFNDFVKFRIAALDSFGKKTYMHFRAFINSFNDNYGSSWDSISYMGRGEEFFKYSKFTREISVGFTVAAQSREELIPQYKKLNYLASTLAPNYGESGYMGGVITTLTLGGWLYEQPGFIKSLSLTPPQESPWEIAIKSGEIAQPGDGDSKVKELPHIIDVEMTYQPIHSFIPQYQNGNENGPSRFIALKASSTNYNS
jgi:hypothetical protein